MNFKDLLEKYKKHETTEDETKHIEAELEKYEAITDYYSELDDLNLDLVSPLEENSTEIKSVKKAIRKRNLLLLGGSTAIVLTVFIFFQLFGVRLLNNLFYTPNSATYSNYATDLAVSIDAFTELHFPSMTTSGIMSENTGIGRYDLTVMQQNIFTGKLEYYATSLTYGDAKFPIDFYDYPDAFAFTPKYNKITDDMMTTLKELPRTTEVKAFLIFKDELTLEEYMNFAQTYEDENLYITWVGVRNSDDNVDDGVGASRIPHIGFNPLGSGPVYEKLNDYYVDYELCFTLNEQAPTSKLYEQHFKSLLQYQLDHADELKIITGDAYYSDYYQGVLDYIEGNGIQTYGIAVHATPERLQAILSNEQIIGAKLEDVKFLLD